MPLPPALLARLQRRGIVKQAGNEEVIAENYDDSDEKEKKGKDEREYAPGCPNKNNPYHICVEYCYDHWREGYSEKNLKEEYHRRRKRMLTRYPLPEGWVEVYDAGLRRHYYWNPDTDEVCWLSPRHPAAVIGEAACKMAREMYSQMEAAEMESIPVPPQAPSSERSLDKKNKDNGVKKKRKNSTASDEDTDSDNELEAKRLALNDRDRLKRAQRKGIDPMDPAAYSDIKPGKWSQGLREDTKTGVDTTAGGPLFQQRPYPAPGAILKAQGKRREEEEDND